MKPDWKDAPEWANWLARDSGGLWYWYENEPARIEFSWQPRAGYVVEADLYHEGWRDTKEHRP